MRLTKITIENYRAVTTATLDVDEKTTLIIGRNNTTKTLIGDFIQKATMETIIRWRSAKFCANF